MPIPVQPIVYPNWSIATPRDFSTEGLKLSMLYAAQKAEDEERKARAEKYKQDVKAAEEKSLKQAEFERKLGEFYDTTPKEQRDERLPDFLRKNKLFKEADAVEKRIAESKKKVQPKVNFDPVSASYVSRGEDGTVEILPVSGLLEGRASAKRSELENKIKLFKEFTKQEPTKSDILGMMGSPQQGMRYMEIIDEAGNKRLVGVTGGTFQDITQGTQTPMPQQTPPTDLQERQLGTLPPVEEGDNVNPSAANVPMSFEGEGKNIIPGAEPPKAVENLTEQVEVEPPSGKSNVLYTERVAQKDPEQEKAYLTAIGDGNYKEASRIVLEEYGKNPRAWKNEYDKVSGTFYTGARAEERQASKIFTPDEDKIVSEAIKNPELRADALMKLSPDKRREAKSLFEIENQSAKRAVLDSKELSQDDKKRLEAAAEVGDTKTQKEILDRQAIQSGNIRMLRKNLEAQEEESKTAEVMNQISRIDQKPDSPLKAQELLNLAAVAPNKTMAIAIRAKATNTAKTYALKESKESGVNQDTISEYNSLLETDPKKAAELSYRQIASAPNANAKSFWNDRASEAFKLYNTDRQVKRTQELKEIDSALLDRYEEVKNNPDAKQRFLLSLSPEKQARLQKYEREELQAKREDINMQTALLRNRLLEKDVETSEKKEQHRKLKATYVSEMARIKDELPGIAGDEEVRKAKLEEFRQNREKLENLVMLEKISDGKVTPQDMQQFLNKLSGESKANFEILKKEAGFNEALITKAYNIDQVNQESLMLYNIEPAVWGKVSDMLAGKKNWDSAIMNLRYDEGNPLERKAALALFRINKFYADYVNSLAGKTLTASELAMIQRIIDPASFTSNASVVRAQLKALWQSTNSTLSGYDKEYGTDFTSDSRWAKVAGRK